MVWLFRKNNLHGIVVDSTTVIVFCSKIVKNMKIFCKLTWMFLKVRDSKTILKKSDFWEQNTQLSLNKNIFILSGLMSCQEIMLFEGIFCV